MALPDYSRWLGIIGRCYDPKHTGFSYYGGRGITIYDKWHRDYKKMGYKAFHKYVASLPDYGKEGYTLDRVDNDGNYEPGNLRWTTSKEQYLNKRR